MSKDEIVNFFDTLPASFVPEHRPKGGVVYLYTWNDDVKKDDWRADGYRWRQSGSFKVNCGGVVLKKIYFQVCSPYSKHALI